MNSRIAFAGKEIGEGCPCFLIAEAGVNHNGDPGLARALIDAALEAGADAVKFQTWITERVVRPDLPLAAYQARALGSPGSQYAMLKALELSPEDFAGLKAHADARGILFLSTPDEEQSADLLDALGVPAFKIGSGDLTNDLLLDHVARKGKPVLLSTGMATMEEVARAVRILVATGNQDLVLLHCVTQYPTPAHLCNLRAIPTLARTFACPVGLSDHSEGQEIPLAAVALGARVIERHLTLDRRMPGPDHRASMEPEAFRGLVRAVRKVEAALGDGVKIPVSEECREIGRIRKVLVAACGIPADSVIRRRDLMAVRGPEGISAAFALEILGRKTLRPIAEGEGITWPALSGGAP